MIRLHSFQANRHQIDEMVIFKTSCYTQWHMFLADIWLKACHHLFLPPVYQTSSQSWKLSFPLRFLACWLCWIYIFRVSPFRLPTSSCNLLHVGQGWTLEKSTNFRSMVRGPSKQLTANDSTKNIFKKPWGNWGPQLDCSRLLSPNIKVQKLSQPLGLVFLNKWFCSFRAHVFPGYTPENQRLEPAGTPKIGGF